MSSSKTFVETTIKLSCAHKINGLPGGHKCGQLHGHTYHVTVRVSCEIHNACGMVLDFGEIKSTLRDLCDHAYLNEVFLAHGYDEETTVENLCHFFFNILQDGPIRKANKGRERDDWVEIERIEVQEGDGGKTWIEKS